MTWKRERPNKRDPDRKLRVAIRVAKAMGYDALEVLKTLDDASKDAATLEGWLASELAMTLAHNRELVATIYGLDPHSLKATPGLPADIRRGMAALLRSSQPPPPPDVA